MKSHTKRKKLKILLVIPIILMELFYGCILYYFALLSGVPLDFSQDYRKIQGIENVVFWRNWDKQCYRRCFWGLQKTDDTVSEDKAYVSDASRDRLRDLVEIEHALQQSVYSPNQDYILYCEIDNDYNHSGTTDDEYCYYKVYEMETGKVITVFQGYKNWYNLVWTE
ncbi:hypothetical protein C809_03966 [Lachnospiraceae bacterium MD335]|nr:hypothetical protein C809_03966 [Lachnospiraceae bacterium MD335]